MLLALQAPGKIHSTHRRIVKEVQLLQCEVTVFEQELVPFWLERREVLINSLPDSSKQLFLELGKGTPVLKTIMGTVVRKAKKLVEVMSKFYGSLKKQYSEDASKWPTQDSEWLNEMKAIHKDKPKASLLTPGSNLRKIQNCRYMLGLASALVSGVLGLAITGKKIEDKAVIECIEASFRALVNELHNWKVSRQGKKKSSKASKRLKETISSSADAPPLKDAVAAPASSLLSKD